MKQNIAGRLAGIFLESKLTPLLMAAALGVGVWTLSTMPSEEEPQIIVPLADLYLPLPGASQDWDAVEIRTQRLADGVYMLTGQGGNMGLSAGPDGAFLIDDQFAPLTDRILAAIRSVTDQLGQDLDYTNQEVANFINGLKTGANEAVKLPKIFDAVGASLKEAVAATQKLEGIGKPVQGPGLPPCYPEAPPRHFQIHF